MSAPQPITYDDQVFTLAFHPKEEIVAAGLIDGQVYCHRYTAGDAAEQICSSAHHKESCRALEFSEDGSALFTGSKDKSLQVLDFETGKVKLRKPKAHSEPINTLLSISDNLLASADDAGCIKFWDTRQRKVAMKYHENVDFIADMTFVSHKKTLLAASGDGCLSVFDIRKSKPVAVSENQDDELLCVQVVRNTTKAVVGTQDGTLLLFSWGDWGDCTDRFPGHPSSVDSMVRINDSSVMTASGDGIIRAIGILPNRLIGAVGDHGDMPVERIRLTGDEKWVGSCSHDATVRFWSVEEALKEEGDSDVSGDEQGADVADSENAAVDESEVEEGAQSKEGSDSKGKRIKTNSSSGDDSDDSDGGKRKERKNKRKKAKRGIGGAKKANAAFFADID